MTTTTTTLPATTRSSLQAEWVNDGLDDGVEAEPDSVLSHIFARSEGTSSFLQASRLEITTILPDLLFPATIPAEAEFVTSQVVIETQSLRLASDPTAAFGLWSVTPYSRSRTIGQVAVINVATDPAGSASASDPETAATCDRYLDSPATECALELLGDRSVWRIETEGEVVHIWYEGDYRYELSARPDLPEELAHTMVTTLMPLAELAVG